MQMQKGIFEKIMTLWTKMDRKKKMENLIVLFVVGVIIMIAGRMIWGSDASSTLVPQKNTEVSKKEDAATKEISQIENDAQAKALENLLVKVKGAGAVKVMITYASSEEKIFASESNQKSNQTIEKDKEGGTRSVKGEEIQNKPSIAGSLGSDKGVVLTMEKSAQIKGVVVVAKGGSDPEICEMLANVVKVVLDLPLHKVMVVEMD